MTQTEDHLDKTTSVSVEMTETGVKAKTKSRFVAAVDRFGGNLVELVNAPMERRISRQRIVTAGETALVKAVTKYGIEKLKYDPEFAQRTAEKYFKRVFERQENKDGVLIEALEDLRQAPPTETMSDVGEDHLAEEFLERLEHYAEGASTERLRQKWGRVLSAEIRKPGSFSLKVLRVVDEIDAETAELFERLCTMRVRNTLPKCLVGKLQFHELSRLTMAGLILDPGVAGHITNFSAQNNAQGSELWTLMTDENAVSFPKDTAVPQDPFSFGPITQDQVPAMPVYLLTDSGQAIATIFTIAEPSPFSQYVAKLRSALPDAEITEYVKLGDGRYIVAKIWPPYATQASPA
jgi:Protein of unknown function (DUF2806)